MLLNSQVLPAKDSEPKASLLFVKMCEGKSSNAAEAMQTLTQGLLLTLVRNTEIEKGWSVSRCCSMASNSMAAST